jgi:hypothetical protein
MTGSLRERMGNRRQIPQQDLIAEMLGPVGTAIFDVVVQSGPLQWILLDLARAWRASNSYVTLPAIVASNLPLRLSVSIVFVAGWIYAYVRWFRWIGWPRLWAVPFVLLILCPSAWLFAQRFRPGIDWLLLLLLQSPIMVLFVLRVRSKARQHRNPE